MQVKVVAVVLAVCLLSLEGTRAAPGNADSFNGNNVGSNSLNNNGNSGNFGRYRRNDGSFNNNNAGDGSFNNNGNSNNNPGVWY